MPNNYPKYFIRSCLSCVWMLNMSRTYCKCGFCQLNGVMSGCKKQSMPIDDECFI